MTSTTDEITNLRAALEEIRSLCAVKEFDPRISKGEARGWRGAAAIARRALKTPRASKVTEPDTLRLDWVLEHCDIAYRVPTETVSERQQHIRVTSREVLEALRRS